MPYTLKPWPTLINNILERNDQQLDTISKFKLENHTVSSPELIANKFNEQFTYIGPTLKKLTIRMIIISVLYRFPKSREYG